MYRSPLLAGIALAALVGCNSLPSGSQVSGTQISSPQRTVLSATMKVPTPEQMRRLIPSSLSISDANSKLVVPKRDEVRVPQETSVNIEHPISTFNFGTFGLYPFSYLGDMFYSPYYLSGLSWYPLAYDTLYTGIWPYMSYPWVSTLGIYSPWIYGLGTYGLTLGAGLSPYGLSGWGWPSWII